MRNAIRYAAKSFGSVETNHRSGTLNTSQQQQVMVKMHTPNLLAGDYQYKLNLYDASNDQQIISLPINVTVVGVPNISVADSLDFSGTNVGDAATKLLTIENKGAADKDYVFLQIRLE